MIKIKISFIKLLSFNLIKNYERKKIKLIFKSFETSNTQFYICITLIFN